MKEILKKYTTIQSIFANGDKEEDRISNVETVKKLNVVEYLKRYDEIAAKISGEIRAIPEVINGWVISEILEGES